MIAIGVLGLGNVGTGFMELLNSGKQTIENRLGTSVSVKKILVRDTGRPRARLAAGIITDRPDDILEDPSISIVVELMGGLEPARTYIRRALSRGKSVVTANKEVVSCYGAELMDLARENGVRFLFEGSVGGGIPIIRPIKECLAANEIHSVTGILNGTTNFILTRMEEDSMELNEALAGAQRLGYAEADPANDITGADVARKIAILATMAFRRGIIPDVVSTTGIDRVTLADMRYAGELGYRVKLLGHVGRRDDGYEAWVAPALVPLSHPLAGVRDSYNAVMVEGNACGTLMFYGRGAGGLPTASAVMGDVMEVIRGGPLPGLSFTSDSSMALLESRTAVAPFYIRLKAKDEPGVLAAVSGVFGRHGISLSMVLQKNAAGGIAEIVIVTHKTHLGAIHDALIDLTSLSEVPAVDNYLRVWR